MELKKETYIGTYEVIAQGLLNVFDFQEVRISITESNDIMRFKIRFQNNGNNPDISTSIENEELVINMQNVFRNIGGMTSPLIVASTPDEKHKIYFIASIITIDADKGCIQLSYNFLRD